ncbi:MAG: hypothetical protein ACK4HW_08515 [Roseinatronobacter sp.]
MTALPGQVAHDLRAWVRFWDKRLCGDERKMLNHMNRAANAIEEAMLEPPATRDRRKLKHLAQNLREHSRTVDHWQVVFGATQLATSLWRAAACLDRLLSEVVSDD